MSYAREIGTVETSVCMYRAQQRTDRYTRPYLIRRVCMYLTGCELKGGANELSV